MLLMLAGAVVIGFGIRRERDGLGRPVTELAKALAMARALRIVIFGLAMIGVGAGWRWGVQPLLVVSLVIAGEELLETSVVVAALAAELRSATMRAGRPPSPRPS